MNLTVIACIHHISKGMAVTEATASDPDEARIMSDLDGQTRVDCAVVIVTYNSARHIMRLLDSLVAAAGDLTLRTLVVDNGSADHTVQLVRDAGVTCIDTGANVGYAGGVNIGREYTRPYSALLILNPDVELAPRAIEHLYETLDRNRVGAAVPMLTDAAGVLYPSLRREPNLLRALGDAAFGRRLPSRPRWLSETVYDYGTYQAPHNIDWSTGAVMLVSEACDKAVGRWDSGRFFLYSEETDYAVRIRQSGFAIRYMPYAKAQHYQGGSGSSPALTTLMAVNRVRYYEKHHGRLAAKLFHLIVLLNEALRSVDPSHRLTAQTLLRRSAWPQLPGGVC